MIVIHNNDLTAGKKNHFDGHTAEKGRNKNGMTRDKNNSKTIVKSGSGVQQSENNKNKQGEACMDKSRKFKTLYQSKVLLFNRSKQKLIYSLWAIKRHVDCCLSTSQ